MTLSAVYLQDRLQHRLQLLERHLSTIVQMIKLRQPADTDSDDLSDLERIWQAEVEDLHAALRNGNCAFFEARENEVARRRAGDDWDAQ